MTKLFIIIIIKYMIWNKGANYQMSLNEEGAGAGGGSITFCKKRAL